MIRRLVAGVAVAAGLALSVTGCAGIGDKAGETVQLTAAQVLGKAAEKTGKVDSFAADLSMQVIDPKGTVSMTGDMQYRSKPDLAYRMTFDKMLAGSQNMGGMETVLLGRAMYMKMPMLSQLGGGSVKPWVKISLDELGAQSGLNIDQLLQQSQQMDPVQNTRMLTASKNAREVGRETLDGVRTTHYTGNYRLEDAIAKLPADQQAAVRKNYAKSGMKDMGFDLWVDDQQLPRQLTMAGATAAAGSVSITMKYHDYGKPVQISAPPAGEVSDFSELMKGLPGAGRTPGA